MTRKIDRSAGAHRRDHREGGRQARRVRLPGFIIDEEIGIGDVIKRTAAHFGVRACGGCERRAAALNRWLIFTTR